MIVLLSLTSTKRMSPLVNRLARIYNQLYFSHFEGTTNPGTIFEGVKAQLCITLCRNQGIKSLFSTHYFRAYSEERPYLFKKIKYQKLNVEKFELLPKVSDSIPYKITKKLLSSNNIVNTRSGNYYLYLRNMGNFFWKLAFTKEPLYKKNGKQISSSTVNCITFLNSDDGTFYINLINSSVFFLYWNIYSDCYHLSKREILQVKPVGDFNTTYLNKLATQLLNSYYENGYVKTENSRNGDIREYYRFFPQYSKSILDQIDKMLSKYYGFTQEELDYIINYDIKYRMGDALEGYVDRQIKELENQNI